MEDDVVDEEAHDDNEVGSKRKRTDRADKLRRQANVTLSVTKMKLNTFCTSVNVCQEIERCVQGVTRVAIEASRLVNLHMLHLLAGDTVVPELDQTYFYRAFTLAAGSRHPAAVQVFGAAYVHYESLRPVDMLRFDYEYVSQLVNEEAKEYLVASKNHVVLNISARVSKSFRASLKALPQQFKAPDRNKIIRYFMRCMTREGGLHEEELMWSTLTLPASPATKQFVHSYTEQHLQDYAQLPLDIGGLKPTKNVEKKWWLYLRWLYRIRQQIEGDEEAVRRSFSMLPLCSLQARYIMISSTTLHGVLKRVLGYKAVPSATLFVQQKQQYWQQHFRLNKVEGKNKRVDFEYSLRTDGYAASIVVSKIKTQHIRGDSVPAISLLNKRVVAVDPGRIDLATCVTHTEEGEQFESHYSNGEYREKIGSARASNKRRTWLEKDSDLLADLTAMPSAKTASINQMVLHIGALFKIINAVLAHNFRNRVRCLKFTQFGRKQKVMHDICQRICQPVNEDDDRAVVVAFGAGMFSSSSKGHCPGPVKGVRRALRSRGVEVSDVNEDYTSQLCSTCHQKIEPMYGESGGEAIHSVRRCKSTNCPRTLWNRDVNAALNILHIFLHETFHSARPVVFTRTYQTRLRSAEALL